MNTPEAGHKFLAKLGKKRLRPGGKKATDWLLHTAGLTAQSQVLEVACNMATTAIEIAQRYQCQVIGIDMDKQALQKAAVNIAAHQVESWVTVQQADAAKLPFADNHFDVVINEAMLTMYADKGKAHLLKEYFRVLKPGGCLLTHDIMLLSSANSETIKQQIHAAIRVNAQPILESEWVTLFNQAGFKPVTTLNGPMSLMTPCGMLQDEGLLGTLTIIGRALKAENRPQFIKMFKMFRHNRHYLNYIAVCSIKPA